MRGFAWVFPFLSSGGILRSCAFHGVGARTAGRLPGRGIGCNDPGLAGSLTGPPGMDPVGPCLLLEGKSTPPAEGSRMVNACLYRTAHLPCAKRIPAVIPMCPRADNHRGAPIDNHRTRVRRLTDRRLVNDGRAIDWPWRAAPAPTGRHNKGKLRTRTGSCGHKTNEQGGKESGFDFHGIL